MTVVSACSQQHSTPPWAGGPLAEAALCVARLYFPLPEVARLAAHANAASGERIDLDAACGHAPGRPGLICVLDGPQSFLVSNGLPMPDGLDVTQIAVFAEQPDEVVDARILPDPTVVPVPLHHPASGPAEPRDLLDTDALITQGRRCGWPWFVLEATTDPATAAVLQLTCAVARTRRRAVGR